MNLFTKRGQHVLNKNNILLGLTSVYIFYGFFEPYLNQLIGPIMRFYIIALAGLYILFHHGKLTIGAGIQYIVLWFFFECITIIWARNYEIIKMHFLTVLGFVVLLVCISQRPIDKRLINSMIYTFWIGSFLIGLLSLFFHSTYHFQMRFSARQVLTLGGVQTDPNNQAIFLMYGISISLYYLFVKREKILFSIVTIIINMISMLMTSSRGSFLSLGLMLLLIVLFVIKDWKTKLWALAASLVILGLMIRFAPSILSASSLERLLEFDSYEGGGNRITIWKNALTLINENLLYYIVGAGWGSYYNYNGWAGIHNTYLEMFCNTGLIGVLLFFIPIIRVIIDLWKKEKYLPIFIAISVFLPAVFLDCINKRYFWNAIYFLFVCYCSEYYSENELHERKTARVFQR
mgnify:CR=1 FL=1